MPIEGVSFAPIDIHGEAPIVIVCHDRITKFLDTEGNVILAITEKDEMSGDPEAALVLIAAAMRIWEKTLKENRVLYGTPLTTGLHVQHSNSNNSN